MPKYALLLCLALGAGTSLTSLGHSLGLTIGGATPASVARQNVTPKLGSRSQAGTAAAMLRVALRVRQVLGTQTWLKRFDGVGRFSRKLYRGGTTRGAQVFDVDGFRFTVQVPKGTPPPEGWATAWIMPGLLGTERHYRTLASQLVGDNIATVFVDFPTLLEPTATKRRAWTLQSDRLVRNLNLPLDFDRRVVVAHSAGAAVSATAVDEMNVRGLVAISPGWPEHVDHFVRRDAAESQTPTLVIGAQMDRISPSAQYAVPFSKLGKNSEFVLLPRANHKNFTNRALERIWDRLQPLVGRDVQAASVQREELFDLAQRWIATRLTTR